jgi:hypothetical protein
LSNVTISANMTEMQQNELLNEWKSIVDGIYKDAITQILALYNGLWSLQQRRNDGVSVHISEDLLIYITVFAVLFGHFMTAG